MPADRWCNRAPSARPPKTRCCCRGLGSCCCPVTPASSPPAWSRTAQPPAPGDLSVTSADTVYVSTVAPRPGVAAYDAASGRRLWSDQLQGATLITDLAVINGIVYAKQPDAHGRHVEMIAIRARDGVRD